MVDFLGDEWLRRLSDLGSGLPERAGVDVTMNVVVVGAPSGDVTYHLVVDAGRITAGPGPVDDAEIVVTEPYPVCVRIATGDLDPSIAFMRGEAKVVGNMGKYVSLLPLTQSDDHRAMLAALEAETQR